MSVVDDPHKAGVVSFKLSVHDVTNDGPIDFTKFDAWKRPPPKRMAIQKVRAYIFQCRDLPSADSDGTSDPYVCLWDSSKSNHKTTVIYDNLNPLFYQCVEMSFEAQNINEMPPFVMDIYDKDDSPLDGDDFICRAVVPLEEAAYSENDDVPRP